MKWHQINIRSFFKQSCALCRSRLSDETQSHLNELCQGCMRDLPWVEHACLQCGLPLEEDSPHLRCGFCLEYPPPFTNTISALWYDFPINRIMPSVKHMRGQAQLRWLMNALLFRVQQTHGDYPEALLPVPMHPIKQLHRGFNQAELIAHFLGKHLDLPVLNHHLKKRKRTQVQASLKRDERLNNLKTAFEYSGLPDKPPPKHIAIIDDVMTTGATMTAIALCLKSAGVQQVDVWTLARTPRP
jgi:ComF family protein